MSYGINPQDSDPQNPSDSAPQAGYGQPSYGQNAQGQPSYGQAPAGQASAGYPTGSQPGEQVNFMGAMKNFFRKYAQFSGRASLSEFWWVYLGLALIGIAISTVAASADPYTGQASGGAVAGLMVVLALGGLVSLALIVPQIALTVRRLHDTNKSGWFYFISFIPGIGGLILLVLCAGQPDPAGAAFDA